jgi:hypothetical protein
MYIFKLTNNKIIVYKSNSSQFVVSVVGQLFSNKGYDGVRLNFKNFFVLLKTSSNINFNKSLRRLFLYRLGL